MQNLEDIRIKNYLLFVWNWALIGNPLFLFAKPGNPVLGKTWIVYGENKRQKQKKSHNRQSIWEKADGKVSRQIKPQAA